MWLQWANEVTKIQLQHVDGDVQVVSARLIGTGGLGGTKPIYGIIVVERRARLAKVDKVWLWSALVTLEPVLLNQISLVVMDPWYKQFVRRSSLELPPLPFNQSLPSSISSAETVPWPICISVCILLYTRGVHQRSTVYLGKFVVSWDLILLGYQYEKEGISVLSFNCDTELTGGYDKEEKAARAYDLAALKYWGASTTINFPVCMYAMIWISTVASYRILLHELWNWSHPKVRNTWLSSWVLMKNWWVGFCNSWRHMKRSWRRWRTCLARSM